MLKLLAPLIVVLLGPLLAADGPGAKTIERERDRDAVTLQSGTYAKVYVPATVPAGHAPGLVIALHGMGGDPDGILDWGQELASLRAEVWCAVRGSTALAPGYGWDIPQDIKKVAEITRFAIAHYGCDPARVVVVGFSAGGAMALYAATQFKDVYHGWIACASRGWPGPPGGDPTGLRAVVFLGTDDPVYTAVAEARAGVARAGKGFALRIIEGLAHSLPEDVYALDALRYLYDPGSSDVEQALPALPKAKLVAPGAGYSQAFVPFKGTEVARTKAQAKTSAANLVAKLREPNPDFETILSDAGNGTSGGTLVADGFALFGARVADKVRSLKPGSWEVIETDLGYLVVSRHRK